jgi:NADPH:quinone reductase-like Zn-dependent oxidoreductase
MFQTAYGSITTGLDLQPGQTLLIRGGTSTVGLSAAALAKQLGARVIATTRNPDHVPPLLHAGAEHAIADDGALRAAVREFAPDGVDAALQLVGTTTLPDTLTTVRKGGIVCFTGALAGGWTIQSFSPFIIPTGVQLTSYAGEASDLPAEVFATQLEAIKNGSLTVSVARVYHGLDQVRDAHRDLETGGPPGIHVAVLD